MKFSDQIVIISDGVFVAKVPNTEVSDFEPLSHYKVHCWGGARGVMVIVVGNGLGDTSSNHGRDWLHFT